MTNRKALAWKIGAVLLSLLVAYLVSSTVLRGWQQTLTRKYGMSETIQLDPGKELMTMTWQDKDHLWLLIRDKQNGRCEFREHSRYGWLEGTIYIKER